MSRRPLSAGLIVLLTSTVSQAAPPAPETCPRSEATCPYITGTSRSVATLPAESIAASTIENLQKLHRAAQDLTQADALWEAGAWADAARQYQTVAESVPGSRMARQARERLDQWVARQVAEETGLTESGAEESSIESAASELEPIGYPRPCCPDGACACRPLMTGHVAACTSEIQMELDLDANGGVKMHLHIRACDAPLTLRSLGECLSGWAGSLSGQVSVTAD